MVMLQHLEVMLSLDMFAMSEPCGAHECRQLPRPATVTDAITQEKNGDNLTEITVEIDPPATFIFSLE